MRPIGRPFTEAERLHFRALYFLGQGVAPGDIVQRLQDVNATLTPEDAYRTVLNARQSEVNAVNAALAEPIATVGEVAGQHERATPFIVNVEMTVAQPGRANETHTIRLDNVSGTTSMEELAATVEAMAESEMDSYFGEGATFTWRVTYIL